MVDELDLRTVRNEIEDVTAAVWYVGTQMMVDGELVDCSLVKEVRFCEGYKVETHSIEISRDLYDRILARKMENVGEA